jgi:2'-5' RNA ligase
VVDRLFLAVGIPAEAAGLLAAMLEGRAIPGSVVPPANWHLTLRFLGSIEETTAERVMAELDQSERGGRFVVELAGLGAFPNPRRATVVWVGVTAGGERLGELAALGEVAARAAGLALEERPFRPHLTLSRVRPDADVRGLLEEPGPGPVRFEADAVTLYRSILERGPARYEPVERFPLS